MPIDGMMLRLPRATITSVFETIRITNMCHYICISLISITKIMNIHAYVRTYVCIGRLIKPLFYFKRQEQMI